MILDTSFFSHNTFNIYFLLRFQLLLFLAAIFLPGDYVVRVCNFPIEERNIKGRIIKSSPFVFSFIYIGNIELHPIAVLYGNWKGWQFENYMSQSQLCLSSEGAKSISWHCLSLLQGWGSLNMIFIGKFAYIQLTILS